MMSVRDLILLVVALEALLHWLPWRKWWGKDLPRLVAYTLGLLGIMGPFSLWLMDQGEIDVLQILWIVVVSAGFTVLAAYGLDRYMDLETRNADGRKLEATMADALEDKGDGTAK